MLRWEQIKAAKANVDSIILLRVGITRKKHNRGLVHWKRLSSMERWIPVCSLENGRLGAELVGPKRFCMTGGALQVRVSLDFPLVFRQRCSLCTYPAPVGQLIVQVLSILVYSNLNYDNISVLSTVHGQRERPVVRVGSMFLTPVLDTNHCSVISSPNHCDSGRCCCNVTVIVYRQFSPSVNPKRNNPSLYNGNP